MIRNKLSLIEFSKSRSVFELINFWIHYEEIYKSRDKKNVSKSSAKGLIEFSQKGFSVKYFVIDVTRWLSALKLDARKLNTAQQLDEA